jgi:hypothetical protein
VKLAYVVEYYKNGVKTRSSPHAGPLDNAIMFAEDGLRRHEVDSARIIDIDGRGLKFGLRGEMLRGPHGDNAPGRRDRHSAQNVPDEGQRHYIERSSNPKRRQVIGHLSFTDFERQTALPQRVSREAGAAKTSL